MGQRTGLVTFTLEPKRGRVVVAKLVAVLLTWVRDMFAGQLIGVVQGLALGMLIMNSAGAIIWVLLPLALGWLRLLRRELKSA